jgi:hypothetical protein
MLVCRKFRNRFMRRPASGDKKDAIQIKPPLRGPRHRDVAGVDGIKGPAKQRYAPASG